MPEFRAGKPTCHLSLVAAASQAAGNQVVLWDGVREDPGGQYQGSPSGAILVERDGLYLVTFGVGRQAVAVSSTINAQIRVGGVNVAQDQLAASAAAVALCGSRAIFLSAGELVTLTATLSGTATASFVTNNTYLTLDRIGPVRWTG